MLALSYLCVVPLGVLLSSEEKRGSWDKSEARNTNTIHGLQTSLDESDQVLDPSTGPRLHGRAVQRQTFSLSCSVAVFGNA